MTLIDRVADEWATQMPELNSNALLVVGKLGLLARKLEARLARRLAEIDLNLTDFDIIATLRRSGAPYTLRPSDLSDNIVLTSGGMTAALTRLRANGLIKRENHSGDGRSKPVKLTAKGVALAEKAIAMRLDEAEFVTNIIPATNAMVMNQSLTQWITMVDALERDASLKRDG